MYNKIRSRDDHDLLATIRQMPTLKEKLSYIWYYYNIHIIVTVAVLAMAISIGMAVYRNTAPVYLNGVGVNVFTNQESPDYQPDYQEQAILRDYLQIPEDDRTTITFTSDLLLQYDEETGQTDLDGGQALNFLDVRFAAKEIDYLLFSGDIVDILVNRSDCLADLSALLTPEEMEQYEDRLCYSSDGVARGIDVSDTEMVKKMGLQGPGPIYLTFSSYPNQPEHLRPFFEFLEQSFTK